MQKNTNGSLEEDYSAKCHEIGGLLGKKHPPSFNTSNEMQPWHFAFQKIISAPRKQDSKCKLSPCST